ncbi:E3 ubiquitin-protein ligase TRIM45-like [Saccostrea echinata]|uniref:E3 ubiquitin-protein ligase TRIM45-like n=1 Tax=Saccostrea echinata TaxID=191078 RepID=UPI002A7FCBD4|nr:E3 ubiquitin-protein ligase TRIM45-like [Saccostrea echinata]
MATSQGQDVIRCQLCSNPVEHHCNLCHLNLCLSCIPKHMADKSRKHEVVEYTSRREHTFILATCPTHKKNRCETYCQDCKIPVCVQCLKTSHKKHEFTNINDILQKKKQQIISDTTQLENTIVPKYRNIYLIPTITAEFDKVLAAIEEQEENVCKSVHKEANRLKDEVTRQKKETVRKSQESQDLIEKTERELNFLIQNNKDILSGNDTTPIINYKSRNRDFQNGPKLPSIPCPQFIVKQGQIVDMIGVLKTDYDSESSSESTESSDNESDL